MPIFSDICSTTWTGENGLLGSEGDHRPRLFSGRHMRSPVARRALGECNAITSRGFGHSGLTFICTLETAFGGFHNAVTID
jgi:hypothetical protein